MLPLCHLNDNSVSKFQLFLEYFLKTYNFKGLKLRVFYNFLFMVPLIFGNLYITMNYGQSMEIKDDMLSEETILKRYRFSVDRIVWLDFSCDFYRYKESIAWDTYDCRIEIIRKMIEAHKYGQQIEDIIWKNKSMDDVSSRNRMVFNSPDFIQEYYKSFYKTDPVITYIDYYEIILFWKNWMNGEIDLNLPVITTPYLFFMHNKIISFDKDAPFFKEKTLSLSRIYYTRSKLYVSYQAISLLILIYESKMGFPSGDISDRFINDVFGYPLLTDNNLISIDQEGVEQFFFSREIIRNLQKWISIDDLLKLRLLNKRIYKSLMLDSSIWRIKTSEILGRNLANSKIIKDGHFLGIAVRLCRQPNCVFQLDLLLKVLSIPEVDRTALIQNRIGDWEEYRQKFKGQKIQNNQTNNCSIL